MLFPYPEMLCFMGENGPKARLKGMVKGNGHLGLWDPVLGFRFVVRMTVEERLGYWLCLTIHHISITMRGLRAEREDEASQGWGQGRIDALKHLLG